MDIFIIWENYSILIGKFISVFMIWIGYCGFRITFLFKDEDILIWTQRAIGILCLLYGFLPKYIFETIYIQFLIIFMLFSAYYLDYKKQKLNFFKSKKMPVKSCKNQMTWDMWLVTIICFFFAVYFIISTFF